MQEPLREIHRIGGDTAEQIPAAAARAAFNARGIVLAGLSDAGRGYRMSRPAPDRAHLLLSLAGAGRAWVDGAWAPCGEGTAYVSPAGAACAFETVPARRWRFAWVYLDRTRVPSPGPLATGRSTLMPADGRALAAAIEGIYHESLGDADAGRLDAWAELVRGYCVRLLRPRGAATGDPLAWLWAEVDARPAAAWSLARLAEAAGVSGETVRKLALAHHGHAPMEHVTRIRMRRADTLLQSTTVKVEAIARMVGYENAFAFSTAFRRVHGSPPNARRKATQPGGLTGGEGGTGGIQNPFVKSNAGRVSGRGGRGSGA